MMQWPQNVTMATLEASAVQHTAGFVVNQKIEGKTPAMRSSVCAGRCDTLPKCGKEKDQKEEVQEKATLSGPVGSS